jgi:hypothetical protein
MTLHPDGLPIDETISCDHYLRTVKTSDGDLLCVDLYDAEKIEKRARTAEAKVAELERQLAWLRRAEFKNLYKPHPSSPVFIMAEEVGQHLASSPPPEWKTPHDNS